LLGKGNLGVKKLKKGGAGESARQKEAKKEVAKTKARKGAWSRNEWCKDRTRKRGQKRKGPKRKGKKKKANKTLHWKKSGRLEKGEKARTVLRNTRIAKEGKGKKSFQGKGGPWRTQKEKNS